MTAHGNEPDLEPVPGPPEGGEANELTGARTLSSMAELRDAVNACRRCDLYRTATQGVPGEGAMRASIMLVGEAPGDTEDIQGHPFVGPAGAMLDRALQDAGLDREAVYISNAVKHFKFQQRGRRRLHVKPAASEVEACHWWLGEEMRLLDPRAVIALGGTAARSLLGHPVLVSEMRGTSTRLTARLSLWVTIHPSFLLRINDDAQRRREYRRFVSELQTAREWVERAH